MGITTVRDVGAFGDNLLHARQAVRLGAIPGPRILACGRIVSATSAGGRQFVGDVPRGRRPGRDAQGDPRAVSPRRRLHQDHDHRRALLRAREQLAAADDAGGDGDGGGGSASHGLSRGRPLRRAGRDPAGDRGGRRHDRARPGAPPRPRAARGARALGARSRSHAVVLLPRRREPRRPLGAAGWSSWPSASATRPTARSRRRSAAGVRLAMGFDSQPHGQSALELVRMWRAGLTPMQAIVAGTAGSAAACGLADHIGSIVPGRVADLVVVDGDPLADPELLLDEERIWLVIQAGGPSAGAAWTASWPSLPSRRERRGSRAGPGRQADLPEAPMASDRTRARGGRRS